MRLVNAIALLAGVAHAIPALHQQQPLPYGPCVGHPTPTILDDEPDEPSEPAPTSSEAPCSTPTLTSVTFNELAITYYGEEIYITGNLTELGEWNPDSGLLLNSSEYTAENPLWYVTVDLPVGTEFEYKYVRKEPYGKFLWESDPNRAYTVEGNCEGKATANDTWTWY